MLRWFGSVPLASASQFSSRNANKGQPESPLSPLRVEEKEIKQQTKRLIISWSGRQNQVKAYK